MPANLIGRALRNRRAGHDKLVWERSGLTAPESITLTSSAFEHQTPIPAKHRGHIFAPNISPALAWTTPPHGTAELVLIIQDPDAPSATPAIHGITIGIDPSLAGIPENGLANPSPIPGLRHGAGAMGRRGWIGPMPVRSHGPHAYVFQLFAVDRRLELPDRFTLDELIGAISGHVLGRSRLDGIYEVE